MEYDYTLKKEENSTHATTWMDLKNTMPNKISQAQKNKYCRIPLR